MDKRLSNIRRLYGSTYVSTLRDGVLVPWRQLSLGDYFEYDSQMTEGKIPQYVIEEEIFRRCVLDKSLVQNMYRLKAGTITVVARAIMLYSGPQTIDELNSGLNLYREIADQLQHKMAIQICKVFPAYKPEDIYAMDYNTVLLRVAQAERVLAERGELSEPIYFAPREEEQVQPQQEIDPRRLKEMHDFAKRTAPQPSVTIPSSQGQTVISSNDVLEHSMAYTGHEMEDRILLEHEMVKQTAPFYQEYVEQMSRGEKVEIKSVEERMKEARAREARNKERYLEHVKAKGGQEPKSKRPDKVRRAKRVRRRFSKR
jgi:hypothetical protein